MFKATASTSNTAQHVIQKDNTKKALISQSVQVGVSTLMSRLLGLMREFLMSQFLGVGEMADAFFTAFKIPNSLRKIFAEGALSAACIPTFVSIIKKESKKEASALMTLSFLAFEGVLIFLCALIFWKADLVVYVIAPGWYTSATPLAQAGYAISYLRLLIAFIVFLSSSALLTGALQSVNHFFVPAFGPVLLNVVFIAGLVTCLKFGLSVEWLCVFILFGGFVQFLLHVAMYFKLNFTFGSINRTTLIHFSHIMKKFLPCLLSMSILELNLFMSTSLATYLPQGSIALLYYANRFMGIPLGVLIGAFSTILLPYFSRISIYAPQRLSVYLFEAAKVVFWVTIPCTLLMSFLAEKIFHTLFLSEKFSLGHVVMAAQLLTTFLTGLFFFSLYKVLLNIYYALHDTKTPCYISIAILAINYGLCKTLAPLFGVNGLALAFVITSSIHVMLFSYFLHKKFNFKFYFKAFGSFVWYALLQICAVVLLFMVIYHLCYFAIKHSSNQAVVNFLLFKIGFWLWVGPLCALTVFGLLKTRKLFNVRLFFLD